MLNHREFVTHEAPARVQTIERTGKTWKAQQLIGALIAIIGIVFAMGGSQAGTFAVFVGFAWFVVARIGSWWHHG